MTIHSSASVAPRRYRTAATELSRRLSARCFELALQLFDLRDHRLEIAALRGQLVERRLRRRTCRGARRRCDVLRRLLDARRQLLRGAAELDELRVGEP